MVTQRSEAGRGQKPKSIQTMNTVQRKGVWRKEQEDVQINGGAFYLERCWLLVYWCNEDHQLVIDAQVAKDVTLWHRDVKPQDLQDIVDRHRLVLVQLHTEVKGQSGKNCHVKSGLG